MHSLIRHFHVQGIGVGIRIDRHGGNAHLPRRLDHAAGNLSSVGDQDFFEHIRSSSSALARMAKSLRHFFGVERKNGRPVQTMHRTAQRGRVTDQTKRLGPLGEGHHYMHE